MKRVAVHLRDLEIGERFWAPLTGREGQVISYGHVLWHDRTERATRVQAVLVRYGAEERIHVADFRVEVDFDRPHAVWTPAEEERRWADRLPEPGTFGQLADIVKVEGGRP